MFAILRLTTMAAERVQKLLAQAGYGSRRSCEALIRARRVTVNGDIITLGARADGQRDDIRVDGKQIQMPDSFVYIILNKPRGVISDEDVTGRLKPARGMIPIEGHLFPVGRLDVNSSGLLLFTNDGQLAHRLTHPRYEHEKQYEVLVQGKVRQNTIVQWEAGVVLQGKKTAPAKISVIKRSQKDTLLAVTLREGRKRQIRRVAAQLGHPVLKLLRERIGPILLGDLASGAWRYLTANEIRELREYGERPARKRR